MYAILYDYVVASNMNQCVHDCFQLNFVKTNRKNKQTNKQTNKGNKKQQH